MGRNNANDMNNYDWSVPINQLNHAVADLRHKFEWLRDKLIVDPLFNKIVEGLDEYIVKQPDPYLQPGWPCEVWNDDWRGERLCYYTGETQGKKMFVIQRINFSDGAPGNPYTHYHPIGTEWEPTYAPEWATHVYILKDGQCQWQTNRKTQGVSFSDSTVNTVLPKKYYGQIISRPEWAKGGQV